MNPPSSSLSCWATTKEEEEEEEEEEESGVVTMGDSTTQVYFVFMNYDPEYESRLGDRSKNGSQTLDSYLTIKHDRLLREMLGPNTYKKRSSLAIVDGFAVEMTEEQAAVLRSAKEVRVVEKNQELD